MQLVPNLVIEKEIKDSFSIQFFTDKEYKRSSTYRLIYNRILLIDSGVGQVKIDDNIFKISSSKLFLMAKGQLIHFKENVRFTGYELSFGDCFWEKAPASANNCKAVLFNNASANQIIPLIDKDYTELIPVFKFLTEEFKREEYINKIDVMAAYLKIIMIKIANVNDSLAKKDNRYENELYVKFLELISKHHKTSREVKMYAGLLGITARKLTDLSKRCSNSGAKELINAWVMAEAKRCLQFSSDPVKEIAFELNFETADQFSHFFKKNAKISPHEYRKLFLAIGV
ncbi:AraC-like DNA-binding protein [Chryseobacterium ginsenosidimutans]|uniref:helix-turn-helix domain-containing protein n=1 Tax=Chryseobacterium ginsenosidimutans TaxID=687846 RepID=UPI002783560E|nr:helix-turn-helix domain-containing protein [Chryseobacterium ginsenosidimutans]MDQ0594380.1 AraC-like DNA-binding protein [Chryseobacterium ginsenosidimutans]